MRPVTIKTNVNCHAEGSCLIEVGMTRVLCTASVENRVPHFRRKSGLGWLTAEYSMLPRSTSDRMRRDGRSGGIPGRTAEIQRLIGRSLRVCMDFASMGERQIVIDCDVLQADGGTRCAAICGGWVALALATRRMRMHGMVRYDPVVDQVAAVSCGLYRNTVILDMDYSEDSSTEVDGNFVMTASGQIVEIQCSAEGGAFSQGTLDEMLTLARGGIDQLHAMQKVALDARAGSAVSGT